VKRIFSTLLGASCLVLAANSAFAQTARARIADTPIRAEANLTSATVATLREGDSVDVIDAQGSWYRVLVPGIQGKPQVGYVMARLIDIVEGDGSAQRSADAPANRAAVARGPQIPPTAAQIQQQHAKATARQQALKSEVDALQARLDALQNGQPIGQGETSQVPQPAAPRLQTREGVWFNAGFGLGTLSCIECDGWLNGLSGGLSVGRTMSDRLLLGVGTTGFYKSVLGIGLSAGSVADARLRFYPVRTSGFFITGGMGLGSVSIANEREYGLSTVLGLGWDVRVRRNLSLTPFWNGIGVVTSNANASVGQIGLGITVH